MTIKNKGKNPNDLHDFLIENSCIPLNLHHNRVYAESGITEATEIYIDVEPEKEELLINLVADFMNSYVV